MAAFVVSASDPSKPDWGEEHRGTIWAPPGGPRRIWLHIPPGPGETIRWGWMWLSFAPIRYDGVVAGPNGPAPAWGSSIDRPDSAPGAGDGNYAYCLRYDWVQRVVWVATRYPPSVAERAATGAALDMGLGPPASAKKILCSDLAPVKEGDLPSLAALIASQEGGG